MFIKFNYEEDTLTDDDFEEKVNPNNGRWNNVIDVYEKRSLNVAKNLARSLVWWIHYNGRDMTHLPELINIIKMTEPTLHSFNNLRFLKYEEEINKYLMLI